MLFSLEKTFTNGEYQQHLNALSVCHRNRFFTSWLVARPILMRDKGKPTNQVIRYKHEDQVSAKIMLEQKANFLKFDSN